jgi:hypothetical protein
MLDHQRSSDGEMTRIALLYLAGELDPVATESFETQLLNDPIAQDHLAHAVQLTSLLEGKPTQPDPSYRTAVRETLLANQPVSTCPSLSVHRWSRISRFSGMVGATAIAIGVLVFSFPNQPDEDSPSVVKASPAIADSGEESELSEPGTENLVLDDEQSDMAEQWSELSNFDHLQKTSDEEQQRRIRKKEQDHSPMKAILNHRFGTVAPHRK